MRVQVVAGGNARSVAVSIDAPDATIADLAQGLFLDPGTALVVDGVVHLPDAFLADVALVDGALISPLGEQITNRSGMGNTWVGVAAGPNAGSVHRLEPHGTVSIGRDPANDFSIPNESISSRHALVELDGSGARITDAGSLNGTWVENEAITQPTRLEDGEAFRIGSSTGVVRSVSHVDRPLGTSAQHRDSTGKILINRPPRSPVAAKPTPVTLPDKPAERQNPTLTAVSILVPLIFAGVMVLLLRDLRFALFGLLSPVMVIGNWLSGRRRVRREREGDVRTHRDAMQTLRKELTTAVETEQARRRSLGPDLLEIRRRVELPSSALWERRHGSDDAFVVRLGVGQSPWAPPTEFSGDVLADDVSEALDESSGLDAVEILVDLTRGPLGLVGPADQGAGVARSLLVQLAAHHGPADCQIVVLTTPERLDEWRWAAWLPHMAAASEGVHVLAGEPATEMATALLQSVEAAGDQVSSGWVIVVDDLELIHQRSSATRRLFEMVDKRIYAMALVPSTDQLPASIASIAHIDSVDGAFTLTHPTTPGWSESGVLDSAAVGVAEDLARSLARFDDPEKRVQGGAIPRTASARDLFGDLDAPGTRNRWLASKRAPALVAPLGLTESGSLEVDLVSDGPHGLVAGTTGAGKSELLRTLIVGLASNHDPDDLVFVLIDYKGGSAFDCCAALPHVVGMVTDLDDHLAERALQSLEAELHVREQVLRSAAAKDIIDYREMGSPGGVLPRLVVVIDEFATLRSELPEFVAALIGIAQRGRSLGVHLILATQRPSGAVDANIRANTNLRIALRVQDPGDSVDVIDTKVAAEIPRTMPGRAFVRRGEGDLVGVQSAYLSGPAGGSGPAVRTADVLVGAGGGPQFAASAVSSEVTDLELLVDVFTEAAELHAAPRRPWLEDLPLVISGDELEVAERYQVIDDADVVLAVADDPSHQRRVRLGWRTGDGHLAVVGVLGAGVTTTIRSAIARLGNQERAVWVFPVDHGAGGLAGIDRHAHVADVIEGNDEDRQSRLLQFVGQELDRRRDTGAGRSAGIEKANGEDPLLVVAVDGVAAFAESNDIVSGTPNGELWERIGRDGPAVGIVVLLGASRLNDVPRTIRGSISQIVVLQQIDDNSYSDFGIRPKSLPSFSPGRALWDKGDFVAQVIAWDDTLDTVDSTFGPPVPTIEALPTQVPASALRGEEAMLDSGLSIPIGIDGMTRQVARLVIRPGEHAAIAGPGQSGRSTTLRLIARQLRASDPGLVLVGVAPSAASLLFDDGVFDAGGTLDDVEGVLAAAIGDERRWVVIVDDADRIDCESGPLVDLAKAASESVTLVVSLRSSAARQAYGHWTRFVRASGTGVVLMPDNSVDGDIFGVRLPRNERLLAVPGRGYLIGSGEAAVVQAAF